MQDKIKFSQLVFPENWDATTQTLTEELYKSIVIDRDNRDFKIITGDFDSKKSLIDFYDSDYIVKRVFLKSVFDWIPNHAKTPLDAYLMYSIAVSKWKNNNMLKDYYVQLVNDIPDAAGLDEQVDDSTVGNALRSEKEPNLVLTDRIYARKNECGNYSIYQNKEDMDNNKNPLFELTEEEFSDKTKELPKDTVVTWGNDKDRIMKDVSANDWDWVNQIILNHITSCFRWSFAPRDDETGWVGGIDDAWLEEDDFKWYLADELKEAYPELKDNKELLNAIVDEIWKTYDEDKLWDEHGDEIMDELDSYVSDPSNFEDYDDYDYDD